MNFGRCLYQVLIGPLKLFFEFIFAQAYYLTENPAVAIVFLSLAMNFLVLPLYKRADKMQESVREQEKGLEPWVSHIRRTFSGDERTMILSAYYRQRHYKPIYALKGSMSLLLEIPFFLGAYGFLSELKLLEGVSLGVIADLSKPDALLSVFGISINLLPLIMTVINIIASAIYLKGFPLKNKIQAYATAVVFLILLYHSPSGLVFYWTLNNVFSLFKNIFGRFRKFGVILLSVVGVGCVVCLVFVCPLASTGSQCFAVAISLLAQIPLIVALVKRRFQRKVRIPSISPATVMDNKIFLGSCVFLTVLTGILIPTAVISDSATEFVNTENLSPLWFVVSAFLYASGTFLIWFNIFYRLATPKVRKLFSYVMWLCVVCATIDYMFFGANNGKLSPTLIYERVPIHTGMEYSVNFAVLLFVGGTGLLIMNQKGMIVRTICWVLCVTVFGMSVVNTVSICSTLSDMEKNQQVQRKNGEAVIPLSTEGKNVVILMMDRAVGLLVPYILHERPDLREQLAGFTYYSNTISFSAATKLALPAVFGGYEYTPEASNQRSNIPLVQKHNEALTLLPSLFSAEGYDVTVINPTYAGYREEMDLSIFKGIPNVNAYVVEQNLGEGLKEFEQLVSMGTEEAQLKNFFGYSLFKTSPLCLQSYLYKEGEYNSSYFASENVYKQNMDGLTKANGLSHDYLKNLSGLKNLRQMTQITKTDTNNFFMMCNDLTHSPMLLQLPEYKPSLHVDNSAYEYESLHKSTDTGENLVFSQAKQITTYHVDMEAFLFLGDWFDYLREHHVYDNTRIILVSDHGYDFSLAQYCYGTGDWEDFSMYSPLLLVKDFGSEVYKQDKQFMTNADVPTIAVEGLVRNPVNPATGMVVDGKAKSENDTFRTYLTHSWNVADDNSNVFKVDYIAEVRKNNSNVLLPECWRTVK